MLSRITVDRGIGVQTIPEEHNYSTIRISYKYSIAEFDSTKTLLQSGL
jgi:hypothetical protein